MSFSPVDFDAWIKTGIVPTRALFGPGFQDDWTVCDGITAMWQQREEAIAEYSFALPCAEAVETLRWLSPLVEVGAGTGAWAAILDAAGLEIVATDPNAGKKYRFTVGAHFPTKKIDGVTAIKRYADRNVLMVWPGYEDLWSANAAAVIRPGRRLALVSEGAGGCVGCDALFTELERNFVLLQTVRLPTWDGIHDRLEIFKRVENGKR